MARRKENKPFSINAVWNQNSDEDESEEESLTRQHQDIARNRNQQSADRSRSIHLKVFDQNQRSSKHNKIAKASFQSRCYSENRGTGAREKVNDQFSRPDNRPISKPKNILESAIHKAYPVTNRKSSSLSYAEDNRKRVESSREIGSREKINDKFSRPDNRLISKSKNILESANHKTYPVTNGRSSSMNYTEGNRGRRERGWCNPDNIKTPFLKTQNNSEGGNRRPYPMSIIKLKELIGKDPTEILFTLSLKEHGLQFTLEENEIQRDKITYLLIALGKACTCSALNIISSLINEVTSNKNFMFNVQRFLANFGRYTNEKIHFSAFTYLVDFLRCFQMSQPSSAADVIPILLPLLKHTGVKVFPAGTIEANRIMKKIQELEDHNEYFMKNYTPEEIKKLSAKEKLQLKEPPENFRSIPVLPSDLDIHQPCAFLRPNVIEGHYIDTEHYLDVQYRLLREDYVKPLRDGIAEYLRVKKNKGSLKKNKDIRVYENVKIIKEEFVNGTLLHVANFDVEQFKHVKWEYSKRFLTGSLLCLTTDDFQTMLFASVARRLPEELQKGLLLLRFEEITDEVLNLNPLMNFVVVETDAYFEAYRYNLAALLDLNEENLPMKKYIVEVNKIMQKPQYLSHITTYDMRPLFLPLKSLPETDAEYNFPLNTENVKFVPVLKENCWPTAKEIGLDDSQYAAVKSAITQEFSVIQGPPGTGKTYVGLRIVQLLLHNFHEWQPTEDNSPILIVCYTNHALDQFLEGVLQFTHRIARIGGRGKNETLASYQLQNLKIQIKEKRKVPHLIFSNIKQKNWGLKELKADIDQIKKSIKKCHKCILGETELSEYMEIKHYQSLKQFMRDWSNTVDDGHIMLDWLNARIGEIKNVSNISGNSNVFGSVENEIPTIGNKNDNFVVELQTIDQYVMQNLQNEDIMQEEEAIRVFDVWGLLLEDRWRLYKFWLSRYVREKQKQTYEMQNRKELKANIDQIKKSIQKCYKCILGETELSEYMEINHYQSLKQFMTNTVDNDHIILDWLNARIREIKNVSNISGSSNIVGSEENKIPTIGNKNDTSVVELQINDQNYVNENDINEENADVEYLEDQRNIDNEKYDISHVIQDEEEEIIYQVVENEDGWQVQGGKKRIQNYVMRNLRNEDIMQAEEATRVFDVWALLLEDRWRLYKFWLSRYIREKQMKTYEMQKRLRQEYEELLEMRTEEDLYVLKKAHVVGMTTTGASKYRKIVQRLNPRILIVEEAAEILESHIVTSLAPDTQHVILIGDHQQLRPNPTVHFLAVKYDLNVSLFERMIKNGMDCHRLSVQHRMRPSIAALLVPHIYKDLKNHESVMKFENIKGVGKNVYFLSHSFAELQEYDSKSRVNQHEAKFLIKLCKHIVLQGYDSSQITVLTTYSGQMFALKKLATGIVKNVRITVVDNFQGEENDVILVSFVRSNEDGEIGFLKVSNRVCVALSRARKFLYCIGNFNLLAEKSDLWKNIVGTLNQQKAIGTTLQLVCQNHPEVSSMVSTEADFEAVPEGGCKRQCEYRLACGHTCSLICHPYDQLHETVRCQKLCSKTLCRYDHPCKKKCYEKCGKCEKLMPKTLSDCHHTINVKCHLLDSATKCIKECERYLSCGHRCTNKCSDSCISQCKHLVSLPSPICGHKVDIECFNSENFDSYMSNCRAPCRLQLQCGHLCSGTCSECHQGRVHVLCNEKCNRILVCGHECKTTCSKSCPPCKRKCENSCKHSKCPKLCGEPCVECKEQCEWSCEHSQCPKLCGEKCDRKPCSEPCSKTLKCKHPCIGLCGEPCPELCRICNEDEVTAVFLGFEDEPDARFVLLEDCNHIIEYSQLTIWMELDSSKDGVIQMKACPRCKTVIRKNQRFGNVVKTCLKGIEKVKSKTFGNIDRNEAKKQALLKRLKTIGVVEFKELCNSIVKVLSSGKKRSIQEITTLENVSNLALEFLNSSKELNRMNFNSTPIIENSDKSIVENREKVLVFLRSSAKMIRSFIQNEYLTASEQQLHEILWEIRRLKFGDHFLKLTKTRLIEKSNQNFLLVVNCLTKYSPFRESEQAILNISLEKLAQSLGSAVLNISLTEKESILKAMALARGHWYQCSNGHVYCITECGGAMEESYCNECRAPIGGASHRLRADNRVASDMDGSRHPAWSDTQNLENYQF